MVLAALSVGGIAYVLVVPLLSGERQASKRVASVAQNERLRQARSGASEALSEPAVG